jgi:hypothetical protein
LIRLPKDYPQRRIPSIKDGGLPNQYNFAQLHFHWGSDAKRGSEHTIKQKQSVVSSVSFVWFLAVTAAFVQVPRRVAFRPLQHKVRDDGECHQAPGWTGRTGRLRTGTIAFKETATHLK